MVAALIMQCVVKLMNSLNGPKLVYCHIFESLDDQTLYSLYMIRKFARDKHLLRPGDGDPRDIGSDKLAERFRCALVRANSPKHDGRRLPGPDGLVKDRGRVADAWYGVTVKLFLVDQLPGERAQLEALRKKLLTKKTAGTVRPWARRSRLWLAVAVIAAAACGAPPVRDVIGTLLTQGVAAARELAYSTSPLTPESLFQQAWVDYRAGEYEAATQKADEVLGMRNISTHQRASCWYLLGSIEWETGANELAIEHLEKAYTFFGENRDLANQYLMEIAIAKSRTAVGDFVGAQNALDEAMALFSEDGGRRILDLGEYYRAAINLEAMRGNFAEVMLLSKKRYDIFQFSDQRDILAAALSDLGFWYGVNGCEEQAHRYTVRASQVILELNDETRQIYNQINWVLIGRMRGFQPDQEVVGAIRQWARIRGDSRVDFYLNLALKCDHEELADDICD